jgi:L-serine deaminase
LAGNGGRRISLDGVVEAMRQTGADIPSNDKDTSLGGLAASFIER